MGALLTASALFSGSTASADEANQPLAKEQVVRIANWDAYVDARDIQTSGPGLNFSNKLVSRNSSTVENWDVYADGRDILPKVKRVNMMDSDFDAYMDARDIQTSGPGLNLSNKLVYRNSSTVENWDVYADGRDILPKVKQVNMMDSDFDAYMDARDINLS